MCSTAKSLLTISDSIAIEILNDNAILTGVGNELHLHTINNETEVLDARLQNKVHGIIQGNGINADKVLIYGEREFKVLLQKYEFKQCFRGSLSDWIIAGIFFEKESGFVLLTAHSVVVEFKDAQDGLYNTARRVSCEDKSTLYCGFLSGDCWNNLTVFGGNAFGELLIWQPKNAPDAGDSQNSLLRVSLLQRIAAHNGVLFSIEYDSKKKLLISTSDDRSIRFWQVLIQEDWSAAHVKPLSSGYGHTARVFQGKIINYEHNSFAVTVGEDSYFCVWRFDDGELLFKQRHQYGAVIWSLAYNTENQIIYTVGSTGNLLAFDLKSVLSKREPQLQRSLALNEIADAAATEYIAKIKFLSESQLIGVTNYSRLLLYDVYADKWKTVSTAYADLKCTVLEVFEHLIAICGFKYAIIYEFVDGNFVKKFELNTEQLSAVVRSFCFLSLTEFLVCDNNGNCVLHKLSKNSEEIIVHAINLPASKERWLKLAILLGEKFLLASNRQGNLLLYAFENDNFKLKDILRHPHGYLGANLLQLIEMRSDCAYVKSAGHDSTVKTLKIDFNLGCLSVQSQVHTPVAWIEAVINHSGGWQSYLGFNDNHFAIWSPEQDISLRIPCGGGHRSWHFHETAHNHQRIRLAFIKNKQVLFYDFPVYNVLVKTNVNLPIRNCWHTRPCNIVEIIENAAKTETIAISAGDDNLIKIHNLKIEQNKAQLARTAEIQSHISNVRALKVLPLTTTKYLIFSGGGRAQLCIACLDLECNHITEILNYTLKTVAEQGASAKAGKHSFDPETRIMSIDVLAMLSLNGEEVFKVYAACSDGYVREFEANINLMPRLNVHFELANAFYYGKCVLQVRVIADSYLLAAATDGYITIFDLSLTQILLKLQLHASGINALDFNFDHNIKLLHLLTGGDDQAVIFTEICLKNSRKPMTIEKFTLPQIHTAQVTAVKLAIGMNGYFAYTSGVDQNLFCIWIDLLTRATKAKAIMHSCVSDIKGLTLSKRNVCLLYGCGLQVLNVPT